LSIQTIFAVSAGASVVATSDTVADLELSDGTSNFLDDTNAFVTKCNSVRDIGQIGATETGMCDLDEDIKRSQSGDFGCNTLDGVFHSAVSDLGDVRHLEVKKQTRVSDFQGKNAIGTFTAVK
jgi:hypothetical protein